MRFNKTRNWHAKNIIPLKSGNFSKKSYKSLESKTYKLEKLLC